MEGKHTPGPWEWEEDDLSLLHSLVAKSNEDDEAVILDSVVVSDWDSGDARLLAAAPDLLEACKEAYVYIGKNWFPEAPMIVHKLRDTIAKAEGTTKEIC